MLPRNVIIVTILFAFVVLVYGAFLALMLKVI